MEALLDRMTFFLLITDQKSIAFMFNTRTTSKIKSNNIARWRVELSCFFFDVSYRRGKENAVVDALSRVYSLMPNADELCTLHDELCHPDITRMTQKLTIFYRRCKENDKIMQNMCRT